MHATGKVTADFGAWAGSVQVERAAPDWDLLPLGRPSPLTFQSFSRKTDGSRRFAFARGSALHLPLCSTRESEHRSFHTGAAEVSVRDRLRRSARITDELCASGVSDSDASVLVSIDRAPV